jgi:hypothetical protein
MIWGYDASLLEDALSGITGDVTRLVLVTLGVPSKGRGFTQLT